MVVVKHPLWYQLNTLGAFLVSILSGGSGFSLWYLLWLRMTQQMRNHSVLDALVVLVAFATFPLAFIAAVWYVKRIWFFIYIYKYSDTVLDVFDPVLRGRHSIQFQDVQYVQDFDTKAGPVGVPARQGHRLVTSNGNVIPFSEALPGWSDIIARCTQADSNRSNTV